MVSIYLECAVDEAESLIAELHERGTLGVMELGTGLRAWFDDTARLDDLIERYDGEMIPEEEEDWVQRTQDSFPAIAVGERFWLAPPWNTDSPPPGRMRLEVNPGLACGTGWHPCTQMCIEALEDYVREGSSVLDVGTGTGILLAAAELLGATRLAGCDVDAASAAIARERVGPRVFAGSVDAVAADAFDVVVANISAPVIESLLPDLRRVCRSGAVLILSGFQTAPALEGAVACRERDGWLCIVAGYSVC
jgi:ribosomal protein L11 methyltransferase